MCKTGVLLINLGTPDNCDPISVYRYLKTFLSDPRVIDLPRVLRWILTRFIILPFRTKKSSDAYRKIWSSEGSPLRVNGIKLSTALSHALDHHYSVELAMRYGNPSIKTALHNLKDCKKIIAIPLFPQYSSAATGSAIAHLMESVKNEWHIPALSITRDFHDNPGFITATADIIREKTAHAKVDLLLFSYHGLPQRHIDKSNCRAQCDHTLPCLESDASHPVCYRAQCYKTSELIAKALAFTPQQYAVAFQSRLGRTPWIQPYTDHLLPELRKKGIKNIAVACPSFVSDCLETLEEINIRAREQWSHLGGDEFTFIPCVNTHPHWVNALREIVLSENTKAAHD